MGNNWQYSMPIFFNNNFNRQILRKPKLTFVPQLLNNNNNAYLFTNSLLSTNKSWDTKPFFIINFLNIFFYHPTIRRQAMWEKTYASGVATKGK